ncbi:LVIVD repeat-containing protein [Haloplanus aerogenes]|uniref:LVIVD repeat-containing protein n=1 Tax=Haloplanus aerogenes TaxID=660522 RepID=A0A3M0DW30_9EURY|nr:LVIVD repeat-containing protein [Haloplanus aerogenes]
MVTHDRRTMLRLLGTGVGVSLGAVGRTVATPPENAGGDGGLRLFSDAAVSKAHETVVQGNYAYVATGSDGMSVVDWRNPGRPEVVAEVDLAADIEEHLDIDAPSVEILDVKVDRDVAALANNSGAENPGGISLYDVSDPTDPQFLAQYDPDLGGPAPGANIHNCYLENGYAYLTVAEPWNVDTDGDDQRDKIWFFGDTGVDIADISDPEQPEHASTWLLKDVAPEEAQSSRAPCHDVYVQDDICYAALWDAGTAALDVSDPANPTLVSRFGSALDASDAIPAYDFSEPTGAYLAREWDFTAYLTAPGNAHYVQPSTNGDHVFVGAETFPKDVGVSDPDVDDYGGISVWDTSDLEEPSEITRIAPPVIDEDDSGKFFTSHNFDVTANRLHTAWYHGGIHIYDITHPSSPEPIADYDPDGYAFWTAVSGRGFTIGGVYGAVSSEGGLTVLHADRGKKRPPAFEGGSPPGEPGVMPEEQRE